MIELIILGLFISIFWGKIYNEPQDPQLRKEIKKINKRNQGFAPRKK